MSNPTPLYQYKVEGDAQGRNTVRYSPMPLKPGDIRDGKLVTWVGNHGQQKKEKLR